MNEQPSLNRIDMRDAIWMLRRVEKGLRKLNGKYASDVKGREGSAANAELSKQMQILSHMLHKVDVSLMDEFYRFKGEEEHLLYEDDDDAPPSLSRDSDPDSHQQQSQQ